jgi:hypothetical protein
MELAADWEQWAVIRWRLTVHPWFAQPDNPLGTAILLSGGTGGVVTPLPGIYEFRRVQPTKPYADPSPGTANGGRRGNLETPLKRAALMRLVP